MTKKIKLPNIDNESPIRISIWGDLVQTNDNKDLFEDGDISNLLGDGIINEVSKSDVVIFNLEAPLTSRNTPIYKPEAPCIASSPKCINTFNALKKLGVQLIASCANNHIKDFGIDGITDTINLLSNNGIEYIGVSDKNQSIAKIPIIIEKGECRAGIYSCAENEFSIADDKVGGANGYDPLTTFDDIARLKTQCDKVIILFHAGRENYQYPSPLLQRVCRKMVDSGADVIICQHSHCIGCEEVYKSGRIIYGQGNFIFHRTKISNWYTGLMISVDITKAPNVAVDYKVVQNSIPHVRLGDAIHSQEIISQFNERSKDIQSKEFIEKKWHDWVFENIDTYCMHGIAGCQNRYILAIDRRLNFFLSRFILRDKHRRKLLLNYIRCESIREAMITLLNSNKTK